MMWKERFDDEVRFWAFKIFFAQILVSNGHEDRVNLVNTVLQLVLDGFHRSIIGVSEVLNGIMR